MKLNTLEKVLSSLENEEFEILLEQNIIADAKKPIIKMLDMSRELGII